MPIRVAVAGTCGRMGSGIIRKVALQSDMQLACAFDVKSINKDAGECAGIAALGVKISEAAALSKELKEKNASVLVDFTNADASVKIASEAAALGINLVIGTTGFKPEQLEKIKAEISKNKVSAVISPNMSSGVNAFFKILEQSSKMLSEYDAEIIEIHHSRKKDAPSGTAYRLAEIIAKSRGETIEKAGLFGRGKGIIGERKKEEIGVHAVRGGDVVGEHTVIFFSEGERIEFVHRATSRDAFVNGVIKAIRFIGNKRGDGKIYSMFDVLGI